MDLVKAVITLLQDEDKECWAHPSPERIHEIDDGDYQGTLVYIIGAGGYQPYKYWYVRVNYGSCSGCDTLQDINYRSYQQDVALSPELLEEYLTLALHIIQGLKKMGEDE